MAFPRGEQRDPLKRLQPGQWIVLLAVMLAVAIAMALANFFERS